MNKSTIALIGVIVLGLSVAPHAYAASTLSLRGELERVDTKQKVVALTFDADMTPKMLRELKQGKVASWYNDDVISVLESEHVPATLFLTGMWIQTYATTTRDLSENPLFELGNHSYSHGAFHSPCYGLRKLRKIEDVPQIETTDALLQKYAPSYVKYFRFPGLCSAPGDVQTADRLGYTVIGGDVEGGDGFQTHVERIISGVVDHVKPGSIVVLHMHGGPDAPDTAVALRSIIPKLRSEGYTFLKVSDLINLKY